MDREDILKAIIEKPKPLSDEQKAAVLSDEKYLRIVAGAGTGKTETLTRRIAYLLLVKGERPRSIVAFTFTKRAAQSIKSRVYERVKQLGGEDACAKLGEMYVGTIHGYCLRILEDFFGFGGYDALDEHQEMAFLLRNGWQLGLHRRGEWYAGNCGKFLRTVNVVYDERKNREELGKKEPKFSRKLKKYGALLDEHKLLTFGRMVALAVEKLEEKPRALASVKYLLVDEYQDINRGQEKLIWLIGRNASVFVVGDPRQSIYQWRGADEKCFDDFPDKFGGRDAPSIIDNRRSGRLIVKISNEFAGTFKRRKYEPLNPVKEDEGTVVVVECDTPQSEAEWVATQIEHLVRKEICDFKDIAVLLRSVTTSAEPFLGVFRMHDLPFLVGGTVGLFRRDEAQAVGRLFAWLWDDGFWVEDPWRWHEQTRGDRLLTTAIERWERVYGRLSKDLRKKLNSWKRNVLNNKFDDFTSIYQELLRILSFLDLDPADQSQSAVMANLGRFNTLLTDYESSIRLGGSKPDWGAALKGLCWYMNTYAIGAYGEQQTDDLSGFPTIQIMTVHQAKGLEWPVVFIPSLKSDRFPSKNAGQKQEWYISRNLFDAKRYEGGLEDERRLFYVAMTRARDTLCMSYFRRIRRGAHPSEFLNGIKSSVRSLKERNALPLVKIERKPEEEEIRTFSAGEIIVYLKCPYLYRLRTMWGYQPGLSEFLGYGKSLHHCLRRAAEEIKRGAKLEESIRDSVEENFHLPYAYPGIKEKVQKDAEKKLLDFAVAHKEDMGRIEEVEARLEFPVQRATITGKVDVILRGTEDNPALEVRDYKTSDDVTTFEDSSLQVRLYSLGMRLIGRPITMASIAYLDSKKVDDSIKKVTLGDDELKKAKEKAEGAIQGIINSVFNGNPGKHCNDKHHPCDYCDICRYNRSS